MIIQNWIVLMLINKITAFSFNQPRFCPNATWEINATTFAKESIIGNNPVGIFVSSENSIYVPNRQTGEILIWENDSSINPSKTISGNLSSPWALFVTTNGDIYVDNGGNMHVDRWITENNTWISVMSVSSACYGLFIDIYDNLYCSMPSQHRVDKKWSNGTRAIVAGTGVNGSSLDMLSSPHGIFVDINLDLYVVDCNNNRIQLFQWNQRNGITVAGQGSPVITIEVLYPTGIVLDGDRHVFIVDHSNHRLIGSDEYGFHCIFGCSVQGLTNDKLNYPQMMSFDSYGNIYVTDKRNHRIQKIHLSKKSCILTLSYNQPRFCPNKTWQTTGITFANQSLVGEPGYGIFVSSKNSIYVPNRQTGEILIWENDSSINPSKTISGNLSSPWALFVTTNGDIYIDNGGTYGRVDKWIAENNTWISVMSVSSPCSGLFIDIYGNLYCSLSDNNRVDKKWSDGTTTIVAGTGVRGSTLDMLDYPHGIFVDINLDLYVADFFNNRIQLFRLDQRNGITVAGNGSSTVTIELVCPTAIVLDGDRHLFIVDHRNHRIVASDEYGFHCIFGCSEQASITDKLDLPQIMSFDSYGNIYVTEWSNSRVQKIVKKSFCGLSTSASTTTQITTENIPSTTMITSTITTTFINNENCLSPTIKLIPEVNSPMTLFQYRRSQDFYILSTIKLKCNKSLSTTKKWLIKNYTTNHHSEINLQKKLMTTSSELYVPSNTLPYGIYQLELTVTMTEHPSLTNSVSVYVQISPSGITANLVPLGTSVVTSGHQQNLILNPGNYSIDPDAYQFNASDWYYEYFCRIYESAELFSKIDTCLSNRSNIFEYNGIELSKESSLIIFANVLQLNFKYQFLVQMSNRRNASLQATGYVIVQIEDSNRPMIAIGCVIKYLCAPNLKFQKINPTTQVALFSYCVNQCSTAKNITWNIYHGKINSSTWTLFNQIDAYENSWFYGRNTTKFTTTNDLFRCFQNVTHWKFEVVYSFETISSISALNFEINQPPSNGSCQINPKVGTTKILFNVSCYDWQIKENIKEYSLYTISRQMIIAFSPISSFEVRLPAGNHLNLVVHIRDIMEGTTEYNLSSVTVLSESISLSEESFADLLSSGNQNTIGQVITLITDELYQIIEKSISSKVILTSISISPLGSQVNIVDQPSMNESVRSELIKEINRLANLREYFISFITDLTITSVNSLKLQSLSLVQLTNGTNQLTRTTLVSAANKCYQLTHQLHQWLNKLPYEDVQIIVTQLVQCASNILSAVNSPLQQRTEVLEKDSTSATAFPKDYDTDLELEWANPNLFADGDDFSWNTLQKGRIFYFQKKLADELNKKINEMISLLTSSLNLHINLGQKYTINTPEVFMSLETIYVKSLFNKTLKQVGDAHIFIPMNLTSNLNPNQTISLRSIMQPMAVYGKSRIKTNTNLSRSLSLSVFDENGIEIPIEISHTTPIEFFIPRDPNLEIPPMISTNRSFHYLNITSDLPISIHFEINANFPYLFIYKFDQLPIYNSSMQIIDGSILVNRTNFTDMIDNQRTIGHQFLIFGLQGNISNYQYRVYTSGCYYLNKENQWKSDGLFVGPLTNLYQTHCYSRHI